MPDKTMHCEVCGHDDKECSQHNHGKDFGKLIANRDKELVKLVKGMGKRELKSPRSFGDGDTVDVSAGYNQALQDVLKLLDL